VGAAGEIVVTTIKGEGKGTQSRPAAAGDWVVRNRCPETIMNIMLVAVVEHTREIGVRMALGARKRDIRRRFLLEAALLSVAGGLVGVALGELAAFGVKGGLDFPAAVTPQLVLAGLVLSAGVGLAAGYWPARSASNLPVVEALRTE
jgi:ABC-type antimicrobial peptide transport system permease subunit